MFVTQPASVRRRIAFRRRTKWSGVAVEPGVGALLHHHVPRLRGEGGDDARAGSPLHGMRGPPHPRELGIVLPVGVADVHDEIPFPPRLLDPAAQRRENRSRLRHLQGGPGTDKVVQHVDDDQRLLPRRPRLHRFLPVGTYPSAADGERGPVFFIIPSADLRIPRRKPFGTPVLLYPSFFFSTSWTILGLAFPRLSFITCPTKKERSPALPAR